jgi:Spy/CpxP family protein refolding chaperone
MRKINIFILAIFLLVLASSCGGGGGHHQHSSYAGEENQTVKAMSDEDIQKYLNGEGMGFAKAAELNGFPGPKHILENKAKLNLSAEQEAKVLASFQKMKTEAVSLGKQIVEKEKELDQLFAANQINEDVLTGKTREIAALQGDLRGAHLRAHLDMKKVLSPEQVENYKKARGYAK